MAEFEEEVWFPQTLMNEVEVHLRGPVPVLPVRNTVLFPSSTLPITVGRASSLKLLEDLSVAPQPILGVFAQRDPSTRDPVPADLFSIGTLAVATKPIKVKENTMVVFVHGHQRLRVQKFVQVQPYLKAEVELLPTVPIQRTGSEQQAMRQSIEALFQKIVELSPGLPADLGTVIVNLEDLSLMADFLSSVMPSNSVAIKQEFLETLDLWQRLEKLHVELGRQVEILELQRKIQTEVRDTLGKNQRDFYLREQLKAIQKELGEGDEASREIAMLEKRLRGARLPQEAEKQAVGELERLGGMSPASPEYSVIRTYLEWLLSLPWNRLAQAEIDLAHAREILDRDHYGLEKVKDRILEYLAVLKLKPEGKAPILCFLGPPGVGKTSLGKAIADALCRRFIRISLGGIRDEAEIRGHRRTYIGSLPGQIIHGIRRAEERNPVFMLDEIDKIGSDFRGDPASALLEVLDPEQNFGFRDHYLDLPFDLSKVFFITTANVLDTVPPTLLDRMEVVELHGYTEEEKLRIAEKYLLPRQAQETGVVLGRHLEIAPQAIRQVIRSYTREAGLRNLERELSKICRKRARNLVEGHSDLWSVGEQGLSVFLGAPRWVADEEIEKRTSVPGVAIGLAWTPAGGEILFIEASRMKGEKEVTMTGQLGSVMQESVKAALTWVRSHAEELWIDESVFADSAIHIHIPAGAIPKDGPSAGLTVVTSLVSLLTHRLVRPRLAMTGEITLTGMVLPVGGTKEKVLAAHRFGIRELVLPQGNEKQVKEDLPKEIAQDIRFHFVDRIEEVVELALALRLRPPKETHSLLVVEEADTAVTH